MRADFRWSRWRRRMPLCCPAPARLFAPRVRREGLRTVRRPLAGGLCAQLVAGPAAGASPARSTAPRRARSRRARAFAAKTTPDQLPPYSRYVPSAGRCCPPAHLAPAQATPWTIPPDLSCSFSSFHPSSAAAPAVAHPSIPSLLRPKFCRAPPRLPSLRRRSFLLSFSLRLRRARFPLVDRLKMVRSSPPLPLSTARQSRGQALTLSRVLFLGRRYRRCYRCRHQGQEVFQEVLLQGCRPRPAP